MIRINKGPAPQELVDAARKLVEKQKADFEGHEAEYLKDKSFVITAAYKSPIVKKTLTDRQFNKCCFSEAKFSGDYSQVEHFRPKAYVETENPKIKLYPGYYWLAYEWSNLMLCKQEINCTHKKNFFPVVDETKRNRTHKDNYKEESILIDPSTEEPREHIRFHKDEIRPISERGRETIRLLGLRDGTLAESRYTRFQTLTIVKLGVDTALKKGIPITDPDVQDQIAFLQSAIQEDAEFSSMAIDFLSGWPPLASGQDS